MNLANFDPSSLELVKYITSSHWYHPTTLEQWVEPVSILIFATLCFFFLRWVYKKFLNETTASSTPVEGDNTVLPNKFCSIWYRYWKCFVSPILLLAYVSGICLAIQNAPLYPKEFDVVIRGVLSVVTSLCVLSIFNNILRETEPDTATFRFIKKLRWRFVLILLFVLIYPMTNNPILKSMEHIYLLKTIVRFLICLIALYIVTYVNEEFNNPVLHKLKWPVFILLLMTILFPLLRNLMPIWAQIIRYCIITVSLCYIIYIALIKNLQELYPHQNTWLYYVIIAFRRPLLYIIGLYGFGCIATMNREVTSAFTFFNTIHHTIPVIGLWYGVNSLFSYDKDKKESGSFLNLICEFLAKKYPDKGLFKNHEQALSAFISFVSNLLFLFACYNILHRQVGIKPSLFFSLFCLIVVFRYNNLCELLELLAETTKFPVMLLLIRYFKNPCKIALILCFIYYNIKSMPFSFPEFDRIGEILHHVAILLCFTYGIWQFTAPKNIVFIFENIIYKNDEDSAETNNNLGENKTTTSKIYAVLISHTIRTITSTGVLLALFKQCGYDIDTFVAFVSAVLVAIGFIIQEPITNYFNSIILMKDKPLSKGDWVIINDIEGEVIDVTYRCTAIKKFTQEYVYIPNNTVMSSPIINLSKMQYRPYEMNFNLAYSLDSEVLAKILEEIHQYLLTTDNRVTEYEPRVYFNSFGDSAAQINVVTFIQLPEEGTWLSKYEQWLKIKHEVNLKIINIVKANGAEIATA